LPNSAFTSWRYDDISFINENTGWALYNTSFSGSNTGRVYKTTNGGHNWEMQMEVTNIGLRCVGFADSLTGFIGTLGFIGALNRSPILYRTSNGGNSWDSVTFELNNRPGGLCGMSVLDRNNIFAAGRINSPASITPPYFIKTTNGGQNWIAKNMSAYAVWLVDCIFFSPDSGFVVGSVDAPLLTNNKNVVLFTSDGGDSWTERYRGSNIGEGLWKISFPSRNTGYCSLNNGYVDSVCYLKTTDGGNTWMRKSFNSGISSYVFTQGLGFLNENTGWIGGDINYMYKTTNGGINWQQDNFCKNLNRIRFLNDSIGYAASQQIYKFTNEPIGILQVSKDVPSGYKLHQNFPNPFNPITKISFEIPKASFVSIRIFNILGKEIETVGNQKFDAGSYYFNWDASIYPSGIYFLNFTSEGFSASEKMILLK